MFSNHTINQQSQQLVDGLQVQPAAFNGQNRPNRRFRHEASLRG